MVGGPVAMIAVVVAVAAVRGPVLVPKAANALLHEEHCNQQPKELAREPGKDVDVPWHRYYYESSERSTARQHK